MLRKSPAAKMLRVPRVFGNDRIALDIGRSRYVWDVKGGSYAEVLQASWQQPIPVGWAGGYQYWLYETAVYRTNAGCSVEEAFEDLVAKPQRREQSKLARSNAAASKEAMQLRAAEQEEVVEDQNAELASVLAEVDNILKATLDVDDYVDIEQFRKEVALPDFESEYAHPIPAPVPAQAPPEPVYSDPPPPSGLGGMFGAKKKHAQAIETARWEFGQAYQAWQAACAAIPAMQLAQLSEYKAAEAERQTKLAEAKAAYEQERSKLQQEADAANAELDALLDALSKGEPHAVEKYFGMVFDNSQYPDGWPWPPTCRYEQQHKELAIELEFPPPSLIPTVRQYKYAKAKDQIVAVEQSQKEQKDRYASVLNNMTLRTMHEIWEADRGTMVDSISLAGYVTHVDPATGKPKRTPLIAIAADRVAFEGIDLRNVDPGETVRYLKAVVSKNPLALTAIPQGAGVRSN